MVRCLSYVVFFVALLGCGTNITRKDVDEPCTRDEQCKDGLDCRAGVCLPEAEPDGGVETPAEQDSGS